MKKKYIQILLSIIFLNLLSPGVRAQYQMENLDRGLVAVSMGGSKVFVSWRWLGTEPENISFNLYRNSTKINTTPLTVTNYTDNSGSTTASYSVRAIINGVEQPASKAVTPWAQQYLKVPITAPAGGTTPDAVAYTYNANDASVADLDGDGTLEIILKWDPSNAKDNSQSGYTGNTYIDAYKLNGTRMWRIDMGKNIRSGAHYLDIMVYDFNCDGKAEMMCRTGDGTIDGTGKVIGTANADYRNTGGYVLSGPEYMSVFNGQTGAVMATASYIPARGTVDSWGDKYGNRVDRFRAGVAYLDGKKPSGIFCRGYYTRLVVAAWDWDGKSLTNRWTFDSGNSSSNEYYSQGDHSLSIADVDNDGKQEIISGAAIIDDNGKGYYSTRYGHGDALHVSDMDPSLPGLEVFNIQEPVASAGVYMYSAKDKKVLWAKPSAAGSDEGPGRGVCADISAATPGAESWVAGGGIPGVFDCKGNVTGLATPSSCNFLVWWDGDLLRELLNNTMIDKYGTGRMLTAYNLAPIASNNGTKSTPCLSGDILGDWREEVIWRASANDALYIFTTNISTSYKFRTLMHDPQYRVAIAWQNTGYNQPPHPGFFLGDGMTTPAAPNITIVGAGNNAPPSVTISEPAVNATFKAPASITITAIATDSDGDIASVEFYNGSALLGSDASSPYSFTWNNVSEGTYTITAKATDNKGAVSTSPALSVTVAGNKAPVVIITAPVNATAAEPGSAVVISADASDSDGKVTGVEFFNGSSSAGTDASAPYSVTLNNLSPGIYSITAKATDDNSINTTSVPLTVVIGKAIQAETACKADGILNESNNTGFKGTGYLNLSNATGSAASWIVYTPQEAQVPVVFRYANGGNTSRSFSVKVNGTQQVAELASPVTGGWTTWSSVSAQLSLTPGLNTIEITSVSADGAPNIDEIIFAATGIIQGACQDQAAQITITSPADKSTVTGNPVVISGTAVDPDGAVSKIEILNGSQVIGSVTQTPFSFDWTNVNEGQYTFTVKTTDIKGGTTVSAPVTFTVQSVITGVSGNIVNTTQTGIYPNPSADRFILESRQNIKSVSVTNIYGDKVFHSNPDGRKIEFGQELSAGTYVLEIEYNSGAKEVSRIIKISH